MRRIIGNQAEGAAFDAHKAGDHARPIGLAQFHETAGIGNHLNGDAHIISARFLSSGMTWRNLR